MAFRGHVVGPLTFSAFLILSAVPSISQAQLAAQDEGMEDTSECDLLKGGSFPLADVDRYAALSVRSLEYTFYGKPLVALTESDMRKISRLADLCDGQDGIDATRIDQLLSLVQEAKSHRGDTMAWINKVLEEIYNMSNDGHNLARLNQLWDQMQQHQHGMLRGDLKALADIIVEKQNEIHAAAPSRERDAFQANPSGAAPGVVSP